MWLSPAARSRWRSSADGPRSPFIRRNVLALKAGGPGSARGQSRPASPLEHRQSVVARIGHSPGRAKAVVEGQEPAHRRGGRARGQPRCLPASASNGDWEQQPEPTDVPTLPWCSPTRSCASWPAAGHTTDEALLAVPGVAARPSWPPTAKLSSCYWPADSSEGEAAGSRRSAWLPVRLENCGGRELAASCTRRAHFLLPGGRESRPVRRRSRPVPAPGCSTTAWRT